MAAAKPKNTSMEKREEREHKDLDHDDEKGESAAHKAKVFQKGTKGVPPPFINKASKGKSGKGSKGKGMKPCGDPIGVKCKHSN